MTALESIVAWAEFDLPNWQSDAVRRLLVQAILSDQDRQELLSMLKSLHGLLPSGSPVPQPQPLGKGMVSGAPKSRANIVLKAVKDLQSVNKIPNGSSLPFGHEGLTAIYGENGSGKSGYARVLKRACRARDTQERILPNIYQSSASAAAKATFKLSTDGGPDTEIQWQDGTASDELLTNITVFDSKCARVIINEKNEASYLPYGAHVFEELASLLNWIKGKLEAERPNPQPLQWKEVPATTQVGKILSGITRETPAKDIESAASWNSDDNTKLVQLEKQLADLKANDPAAQAGQVRSFKERVTNLNQQVGRLSSVLSDERLKRLEELVAAQTVAAEAVHLASQETLQNEPLHEAGGSAWQILYSAAKDYSTKDAYPGAEYPVAADGSRCVFCMQLLSDEAKERLRRFSAFMEQSTKKEHGTAKSALDAALIPHDEVRTLASEGLHANVLGEITQRDQATATAVESFLKVLRFRLHFVDKLASGQATEPVQPLPDSPDESLKIIVEELELEAAGYDKAVDPKTRENIEKDVVELKGRKCFTENRQKIIDYLYDLKSAYSFDQAKAATSTASISRKGKKVVSEALTPQLKTAIQTELTNLGVRWTPIVGPRSAKVKLGS